MGGNFFFFSFATMHGQMDEASIVGILGKHVFNGEVYTCGGSEEKEGKRNLLLPCLRREEPCSED